MTMVREGSAKPSAVSVRRDERRLSIFAHLGPRTVASIHCARFHSPVPVASFQSRPAGPPLPFLHAPSLVPLVAASAPVYILQVAHSMATTLHCTLRR